MLRKWCYHISIVLVGKNDSDRLRVEPYFFFSKTGVGVGGGGFGIENTRIREDWA